MDVRTLLWLMGVGAAMLPAQGIRDQWENRLILRITEMAAVSPFRGW